MRCVGHWINWEFCHFVKLGLLLSAMIAGISSFMTKAHMNCKSQTLESDKNGIFAYRKITILILRNVTPLHNGGKILCMNESMVLKI